MDDDESQMVSKTNRTTMQSLMDKLDLTGQTMEDSLRAPPRVIEQTENSFDDLSVLCQKEQLAVLPHSSDNHQVKLELVDCFGVV